MNAVQPLTSGEEEALVAELEMLGIRYLSRQTAYRASSVRPAENLLADLVLQPSSRVRLALIPLLLAHPEMAPVVPRAAQSLLPPSRLLLQLLYTAALHLQRIHAKALQLYGVERWQWLPDHFSAELGLTNSDNSCAQLATLGRIHQQRTGSVINWAGTYADAAHRLLRQWEMERQWNG